jgi:hypothetical protein
VAGESHEVRGLSTNEVYENASLWQECFVLAEGLLLHNIFQEVLNAFAC